MAKRGQPAHNPEREGPSRAHRIKAPDAELDAIRDYALRKGRRISHVTRDLWREAIARDGNGGSVATAPGTTRAASYSATPFVQATANGGPSGPARDPYAPDNIHRAPPDEDTSDAKSDGGMPTTPEGLALMYSARAGMRARGIALPYLPGEPRA